MIADRLLTPEHYQQLRDEGRTDEELTLACAEIERAADFLRGLRKKVGSVTNRTMMLQAASRARKLWAKVGRFTGPPKDECRKALAAYMVGRDVDLMDEADLEMAIGLLIYASTKEDGGLEYEQ